MDATGNNADSYSDISAYIYVFCGIMLIFIGYLTSKLVHKVGGLLPIGLGFGSLAYGIYILSAKGII